MLKLLSLQITLTLLILSVNSQKFPSDMAASRLDFFPSRAECAFPMKHRNIRDTHHMLVLTRHGSRVTSHESRLTKKYDTLKDYKTSFLTNLGRNQQIINGANLRLSFPKFFKGIRDKDIQFTYKDAENTKQSGVCFIEGLLGNLGRVNVKDSKNPNTYPPFCRRPHNFFTDAKNWKKKQDENHTMKDTFKVLQKLGNTTVAPKWVSNLSKSCPKVDDKTHDFEKTLLTSWYGKRL